MGVHPVDSTEAQAGTVGIYGGSKTGESFNSTLPRPSAKNGTWADEDVRVEILGKTRLHTRELAAPTASGLARVPIIHSPRQLLHSDTRFAWHDERRSPSSIVFVDESAFRFEKANHLVGGRRTLS